MNWSLPSITTYLNKFKTFLWIRISFPLCLIPRYSYKEQFVIDENAESSNNEYVIARRSLNSKDTTFDEIGLRDDSLIKSMEEIPGLSMNLLGGKFKPKHINYILGGKSGKDWIKRKNCFFWNWINYLHLVRFSAESTPIYFVIKDIHNIEFPYIAPINDKNFKKLLKSLNKDWVSDFKAISVIIHKPVNLNYWHVEYSLFDGVRDGSMKNSRISIKRYESAIDTLKYSDQIVCHALNSLSIAARPYVDNVPVVPTNLYRAV